MKLHPTSYYWNFHEFPTFGSPISSDNSDLSATSPSSKGWSPWPLVAVLRQPFWSKGKTWKRCRWMIARMADVRNVMIEMYPGDDR